MYFAIVIGGVVVCILSLLAYFVVSFIAPEWLGMSGKKAKELENNDTQNKETAKERPKDFFSR